MKNKKIQQKIHISIETSFVFLGLLLAFIKLFDGIKAFNKWNKR